MDGRTQDPGEIPHHLLRMECASFGCVRHYPLPSGYSLRLMQPGEADIWAAIEHAAGEFGDTATARDHFREEFEPHPEEIARRCFLLTHDEEPVGTATAWYSLDPKWPEWGRLHWVGIVPSHQGRGLSRPLVEAAVYRLDELHGRAFLTSQTTSWKAIRVYLDFGFRPDMEADGAGEAWTLMADVLGRPDLRP